MEPLHRTLLRMTLGVTSCADIDPDLVLFVDDIADTCMEGLHSGQVISLAIETWKRLTGNTTDAVK